MLMFKYSHTLVSTVDSFLKVSTGTKIPVCSSSVFGPPYLQLQSGIQPSEGSVVLQVFIRKKSKYRWTCTVQTQVVKDQLYISRTELKNTYFSTLILDIIHVSKNIYMSSFRLFQSLKLHKLSLTGDHPKMTSAKSKQQCVKYERGTSCTPKYSTSCDHCHKSSLSPMWPGMMAIM